MDFFKVVISFVSRLDLACSCPIRKKYIFLIHVMLIEIVSTQSIERTRRVSVMSKIM